MVGAPSGSRKQAERERRQHGESAIEERGRDRFGVGSAERDEGSGEADLDDPDAGRRQRNRSQDSNERPGGEGFDAP